MIFSVIKMDGSNNSAGLSSGLHYQALTGSFCAFCFSEHWGPLKACTDGGVLKSNALHQSQWRRLRAKPQRKSAPRSHPHPSTLQKLFFILTLRLSASTLTWLFIGLTVIISPWEERSPYRRRNWGLKRSCILSKVPELIKSRIKVRYRDLNMMKVNLPSVQKSFEQHPTRHPVNHSLMSDDTRVLPAKVLMMLAAGITVIIVAVIQSAYYEPGTVLNS